MNKSLFGPGLKLVFYGRSALSKLLLINVIVFLFIQLVNVGFFLFNVNPVLSETLPISKSVYWLALPSDVELLLLRPWTLISYMFLHESIFHIFFNMLMLYVGGGLFASYLGSKKLVYTYIFGGIIGGIFYVVSFNLFPAFENLKHASIALGASASVLAILVAIATYIPNFTMQLFLFGKVKLKYLVIAFIILDLLSIDKGNPGGHIAHIGGAAWGFLSIWIPRLGLFKFKPRSKLKYKLGKGNTKAKPIQRPMTDDEYNTIKQNNQKRIDGILDTISKRGYDALSKEEKDFLFNHQNK